MRLIDADRINFYKATVARGMHSFENVEIVEKIQVDRMPTIDTESLRPNGKWIDRWTVKNPQVEEIPSVECSNCGMLFCDLINNHREMFRFCPHCGAKMDGGENG